jgi:hypothetical protein
LPSLEGSLLRAFLSDSKLFVRIDDEPDRAWTHPTKSFASMQEAFTSALISALTGEAAKNAESNSTRFTEIT